MTDSASRRSSTSGLGIAALVLGIIAALGCWIPFLNVVSMFLAALGLLFALLGLLAALLRGGSGAGMPISGGIVCVVCLVIAIVITGGTIGTVADFANEGARDVESGAAREKQVTREHRNKEEAPEGWPPWKRDNQTEAGTEDGDSSAQTSPPAVACQVLDERVYDAPVKTQVVRELLVSGQITEDGLKGLMRRQFSELQKRRGFKYHPGPTHIFLYAYTDRERAASGMGQWIAMLSKVGEGAQPETSINQRQIQQLRARPEMKFGLSEEKRKRIWKQLVLAEDRATKEAEGRYPLEPASSLSVGQELELSRETPLMPELDPTDALAAIGRIRRLPPGTTIRVLEVAEKRGTPWYRARAEGASGSQLGSGWINSTALMRQAQVDLKEQLSKQMKLGERLEKAYKAEIGRENGLSAEQLKAISVEGVEKDWPFPKEGAMPGGVATAKVDSEKRPRTKGPTDAATSRLNMAKLWLGVGSKDKAAGVLRDLIEKYPNSEAAKEGRELLGDL